MNKAVAYMEHVKASRSDLVQLAKDLDKFKVTDHCNGSLVPGFFSEKYDGVYCLAVCIDGDVAFYSRTGEQCLSIDTAARRHEVRNAFSCMDFDGVIIAECWHPEQDQQTVSGNFRRKKAESFPEALLMCHDVIGAGAFADSSTQEHYEVRLRRLNTMLAHAAPTTYLRFAEQTYVGNIEQFKELTKRVQSRGGEGGILRPLHAAWSAGKRNHNLVRVKQHLSYDLEVTGLVVGEGKYAGTTGAILVRFKPFEDIKEAAVYLPISGMTDAERHAWWADPKLIVGKIVQVDAMRLTNLGLLREPRYKGIRTDKVSADF